MNQDNQKEHYEKKNSNFKALPYYSVEYNKFYYRFINILSDNNIEIEKSDSLIDLGCAFGVKTYILSPLFKKVTGIDFIKNSTDVACLLNDKDNLFFECADVLQEIQYKERYNFITAFGLSVLNKKNVDEINQNIKTIINRFATDYFTLIIGSETDFSGKSPSGWHYHTMREIKSIINYWNKLGYETKLYFPYKKRNNYTKRGISYFLYETFRTISSSKREYYIIIKKKNDGSKNIN